MEIVAGTGHRPHKLGGYSSDVQKRLQNLAERWLSDNGPHKVISGVALGWDTALAKAAIALGIPLIAAVPFEGQESKWPKASQIVYRDLLEQADDIVFVSEAGYAPWKMQARNKWMTDNCTTLLALWDGTSGGTGNCIQYATKTGKPVINLWDEYQSL
jgi:uncharacterized phage-like protein YoqJ